MDIMTALEQYFKDNLHRCEITPQETKNCMARVFGAAQFLTIIHPELEETIANLWNYQWRDCFMEKI